MLEFASELCLPKTKKSRHGYGDTHVGMNKVEAVR